MIPEGFGTARSIAETQQTAPTISLEGVSKRFGTANGAVAAVSGVSLEFQAGELIALIGPSGSGKTTLISLIGGILRPTAGKIVICGQDVANMAETDRNRVRLAHMGFIFQSYHLFPSLTARQNVEIALDLKGVTGRARAAQAQELLEYVDLGEKAHTRPGNLSGGQQQRVAIARALAGSPRIILADEPTAALDSQNGRRVMKIFRSLARSRGCTVIIVTHDSRIADLADRIVSIEDGQIVDDRPQDPAEAPIASLGAKLIRRPTFFESAS